MHEDLFNWVGEVWDIEPLLVYIKKNHLRWFGHLIIMAQDCLLLEVL